MRKAFGFVAVLVGLLSACSSSSGNNSSGGRACCSTPVDDAGIGFCGCQPVGTVSQGGFSSTLTVNGSSCTVATTSNGMSQTATGSVVASCTDGG